MSNRLFIKNAAILTFTSLIIRGIGILFRVYIAAQIGAEGMGLYQLVTSIYILANAAGSGLPTAVSEKLSVMKDSRSRLRPLIFSVICSAAVLSISGLIFFIFSDKIAVSLLSDERTALAIKIFCLSLPFMGMTACIKGYFYAKNKTATPCSAQITEQIVRILVIFLLLWKFAGGDVERSLASVLLGDTVAEIFSFIFMLTALLIDTKRSPRGVGERVSRRSIIGASLPITGSRYLTTILRSTENIIIPVTLTKYSASAEEAVVHFGMLKGMAIPLIFFPASFLSALSTLLLPKVAVERKLGEKGKLQKSVETAIGTTLFAAMPIMAIFLTFGRQISHLLYSSEGVGFIVVTLAPIVPFMYLESVCDGILKGLTQQAHSFLYNIIDSTIRLCAILLIVPRFGMQGFLWIMIFSNIFTSSMNIRRLLKVTEYKPPLGKFVVAPLLMSAAACFVGKLCDSLLGGTQYGFILSIGISGVVYLGIAWVCRKSMAK